MDVSNLHNRIGRRVITSASRGDTHRQAMIAAVNFKPPVKPATDIAPLANGLTYAPGRNVPGGTIRARTNPGTIRARPSPGVERNATELTMRSYANTPGYEL